MTTTPRTPTTRALFLIFTALAFAAPATTRALTLAETFFQAGIGIGRIDGVAHNANMVTYTGLANFKLHDGIVGFDLRGTYTYGDVSSRIGGSMQNSDLNLFVSFPKIPIVKPFVFAGGSYDKFSLNHNFGPEYGWDTGYNVGVGAEVKILPILPITAMIYYTHGDLERLTYELDITLWISKLGVGLSGSYEQGQGGFDNNVAQGNVYVALRF